MAYLLNVSVSANEVVLGIWERLWFVIVALSGLFSYLFFIIHVDIEYLTWVDTSYEIS